MWGATDGKGQSMVYYFSLPEGWEPQQLDNPTALALCQRFVHDGREHDKCATGYAARLGLLCARLRIVMCRPLSPQAQWQ